MSIQVKICGITNIDDAMDAIELGADYLGFNFYQDSKRYLNPNDFKEFITEIPFTIGKIGVFVNCDLNLVVDIVTEFNLDLIQFHGDEKPDYCNQFARPFIKAIRPQKDSDLEELKTYEADYFLIDSFVQNSYGGTGIVSNWDLARKAQEKYNHIFLSGGLNTDNIEMAINSVKPFAVDVASGVEVSPGKKDYHKMDEFIKKAKRI